MAPRKTTSSASRESTASGRPTTPDDSAVRVTAEGNVELLDARVLHEQLCDACDQGGPVEIDLASVTKIGTGGLQALVAFVRDATLQHVPYRWIGVSRTVVQAAKEAGLAVHLDLPEPSPSREVD